MAIYFFYECYMGICNNIEAVHAQACLWKYQEHSDDLLKILSTLCLANIIDEAENAKLDDHGNHYADH